MGEWAVARVQGVLGSWELPFRSWLAAQGYAPTTVVDVVWQLDGLSRWLGCERLTLGELTPERVEQFVAARLAAGYTKRWSRCVLPIRIRFPREVRAVPAVPVPAPADGRLSGCSSSIGSIWRGSADWPRARSPTIRETPGCS